MKTLIFGTLYLGSELSLKIANYWLDLHNKLPYDWLLVDSTSPPDRLSRLNLPLETIWFKSSEDDLFDYEIKNKCNYISFANNIGHDYITGVDGWGRAFCQGIKIAIDNGYDYVVHIEGDVLSKVDIDFELNFMKKENIDVMLAWSQLHKMPETGLMFMKVDFLKNVEFIQKYDWKTKKERPFPNFAMGETVCWNIFIKGKVQRGNWIGDRTPENVFHNMNHVKYITHCNEQTADKFMENLI